MLANSDVHSLLDTSPVEAVGKLSSLYSADGYTGQRLYYDPDIIGKSGQLERLEKCVPTFTFHMWPNIKLNHGGWEHNYNVYVLAFEWRRIQIAEIVFPHSLSFVFLKSYFKYFY